MPLPYLLALKRGNPIMINDLNKLTPQVNVPFLPAIEEKTQVIFGISEPGEVIAIENGTIKVFWKERNETIEYLDCPLVRAWLHPYGDHIPKAKLSDLAFAIKNHCTAIENWWFRFRDMAVAISSSDFANRAILAVDLFTNRFVYLLQGKFAVRYYADGRFAEESTEADGIHVMGIDKKGHVQRAVVEADAYDMDARRFIPLPFDLTRALGGDRKDHVLHIVDDGGNSHPFNQELSRGGLELNPAILRARTWTGYYQEQFIMNGSPILLANRFYEKCVKEFKENCSE